MEDYRDTLQKAKRMVSAGDYEQARKLIRGINHPNRAKWLAAVDAKEMEADPFAGITPAKPVSRKPVKGAKPAPKKKSLWKRIRWYILAIALITLGLLVWSASQDNQQAGEEVRMWSRALRFCITAYYDVDLENMTDGCSGWAQQQVDFNLDVLLECDRRAGALDNEFHSCLIREGILPPGVVRR